MNIVEAFNHGDKHSKRAQPAETSGIREGVMLQISEHDKDFEASLARWGIIREKQPDAAITKNTSLTTSKISITPILRPFS